MEYQAEVNFWLGNYKNTSKMCLRMFSKNIPEQVDTSAKCINKCKTH